MSWFSRLFGRPKAICDQRANISAAAAERASQTPDTGRTTQQDPERMYTEALALFKRNLFKDAARLLEEASPLNPTSAPIYFTLAVTYSRIGGECGNDNAAALPWLRKSGAAFQKAIDLATTHGGLNASQLEKARTSLQMCAPFMDCSEEYHRSPSLSEDDRKRIFADFMETHDSEFLLGGNLSQEFQEAAKRPSRGLAGMMQSLNRNASRADGATYAKIEEKYGLNEAQLRAIVDEGKQRKWLFQGVDR